MVLATDICVFSFSLLLSYLIRFEFALPAAFEKQYWVILPAMVLTKLGFFFLFGMYRGMWRYTDMRDSWRLVQATVGAQLLIVGVLVMYNRMQGFPRSVFLLDMILTFLFAGGIRVLIRSFYLFRGELHVRALLPPQMYKKRRQGLHRVLLVGAGEAGVKMLREIIENPGLAYEVVGFVDDKRDKLHRAIHGVPVLGRISDLHSIVQEEHVDEVLIAIPTASGKRMRQIIEVCRDAGVKSRKLPGIGELIDGTVSVSDFKEVSYVDLLGRDPVRLENEAIAGYLEGKVVMVTGAGGSIGSELVRQIVRFRPSRIVLVERGELNLYDMEMELKHELGFDKYVSVLGRVQDRKLMDFVFASYRPDVVFHAAAYKHVPLVEGNPWEGVFNNVVGSRVVMGAARKYEVDRFVLVSTDKAVRPTNVMGTTKRITELLMQSQPPGRTKFMAVRFGNVIGSSGSVIPLFQKQIRNGGPVTVTHPEMTRFFMTIPEACQLILQAGTMGTGGEIFILKMGTPVRIADMARDLIRLTGKEPESDIEIQYTGMRPGEKLYEELITHGEGVVETGHEEIMVLRPENDGDVISEGFRDRLLAGIEALQEAAGLYDADQVKKVLCGIVPEYVCEKNGSVLCVELGMNCEEDNGVEIC
jgi:FlaA1/EpsC-like NDP-sugar epimerase